MAHVLKALVGETSTSTGTGAFALSAALAAPIAHRRFNDVCAVGDTVEYMIRHATDNTWEAGIGTYSAANTLTRTLVTDSSSSGAAVSFAAGDKFVLLTPLASRWNGWELVNASAPSAAASVEFTGLSEHFEYRLEHNLYGGGGVGLFLYASITNGSTWESGGVFNSAQSTSTGVTQTGAAYVQVLTVPSVSEGYEATIDLLRPYGRGGDQRFIVSSFATANGSNSGRPYSTAHCNTIGVNAVKLQPASGTLTGTVRLLRRAR